MITTADIRDYFKTTGLAEHYYVGKLDRKKNKSLGVYTLRQSGAPVTVIGRDSSFTEIAVSLLVHWSENALETEQAANAVYEHLRTVKSLSVADHTVYMLELLTPEPVDVGTDEAGVYERVIELRIYYERK